MDVVLKEYILVKLCFVWLMQRMDLEHLFDQTRFSFQYTFFSHENDLRKCDDDWLFNLPMT